MVSLHCFCFWKIASKLLSFHGFFTSNRIFDDYFVWKACTQFQKIWSWTRYERPKFVKNALIFWSHSTLKNAIFSGFFLSLKEPFVVALGETCLLTSRTYLAEQGMTILTLSKTLRLLSLHPFVFSFRK